MRRAGRETNSCMEWESEEGKIETQREMNRQEDKGRGARDWNVDR